jgi:hypothetical protein
LIIHSTPSPQQLPDDLKCLFSQVEQACPELTSRESGLVSIKELASILENLQLALGIGIFRDDKSIVPHDKAALHESAGAFAETVWQRLVQWRHETGSLLGLVENNHLRSLESSEVMTEMHKLCEKQSDFHWARLRSICDGMIRHFTAQVVDDDGIGTLTTRYSSQLAGIGGHWFRKSVALHTGIGFHTAVSAIFKICATFNEEFWLTSAKQKAFKDEIRPLSNLLTHLASCHLVILHASDGVLWDSAGVKKTDGLRYLTCQTDSLQPGWYIKAATVTEIICRALIHFDTMPNEPRVGCPALKSWGNLENRLIIEVQQWILEVFETFAVQPLIDRANLGTSHII